MHEQARQIAGQAITDGYRTVHLSDTEILFCKANGPKLTRKAYYAGATWDGSFYLEFVSDGLKKGLPIRYVDDFASLTPCESGKEMPQYG